MFDRAHGVVAKRVGDSPTIAMDVIGAANATVARTVDGKGVLLPSRGMAKVHRPVIIAGTTYRVLRLDGARGPRYPLRRTSSELIELFPRGAEPMRLYAAPLVPHSAGQHPLARLDFFDRDGHLTFR